VSEGALLSPGAAPSCLAPLVSNAASVPQTYRRRVPPDVLASVMAANAQAALNGEGRDAAVLVLFSGPDGADTLPQDADLLVTVRASTLRHHAGQAAFPGGAADPGDDGPVATAFREAREETGVDTGRLIPLATLERMFIPPSGFHVVPVLAYSPDPGPVAVVDESETAIVARVPVRAFVNPENRLMVYRKVNTRRFAGPAFLLNQMLVWGFTGQVISAMLDVAGWAEPWNTDDVRELEDAIALVGHNGSYGDVQQ
jgi:8-oxo-dGTP pyrophosphatase MutT (NUDIX family)